MLVYLTLGGAVFVPVAMFVLRRRRYAYLFDLLAALALLLANLSAARAVLDIKVTGTEFTTHVHEIFNDPLFLLSGSYLGVYAVYRLLVTTAHTWSEQSKLSRL